MGFCRLDWRRYLTGLARDLYSEWTGRYYIKPPFPTRYLSPTGLALSCDAYGGDAYVMSGRLAHLDLSTYRRIGDGAAIWMRIEALPAFVTEVLPHIDARFVLVTGESDWSVPSNFTWAARQVVESGKLIHWFTVNYDGTAYADKITPVPLGIEYPKKNEITINLRQGSYPAVRKTPAEHEAEWARLAKDAPPLDARPLKAVADFHFNDTATSRKFGETRTEICAQLQGNPDIVWPARRTFDATGPRRRYMQYPFLIVAYGRGLDGHRAWEAMLLGCTIIVKKGPLDLIYRDMPVVSIDDWREITTKNLRRWYEQYGPTYDRAHIEPYLRLDHWTGQIRARAAAALATSPS